MLGKKRTVTDWGRALSIIAIGCMMAACSSEQRISLAYAPATNVAAVAGADQVTLDVVSQDKRAQFKDRVGTVRNSYTKIVADNDVADLVRGAVEHGLKAEGFVLAAGGLIVTVELQNFYSDSTLGTTASVAFTVRARTGAGRTLYSRYYEGKGSAGVFQTAENAKAALDQAVGNAVNLVIEDKALQVALLSAASTPPAGKRS
jgi:uncharacterized lipoprotein YajG